MTYKFKINMDPTAPPRPEVSEEQSQEFLDWWKSGMDQPDADPAASTTPFTRDATIRVWKRWVPRFLRWLLMRLPNSGWAHRIQEPFLSTLLVLKGAYPKEYTTKEI